MKFTSIFFTASANYLRDKPGAKHRLRGFMPRNMVAPYEMRSSEVRGNSFVIKQMRLEDAKSAPIPSFYYICLTKEKVNFVNN